LPTSRQTSRFTRPTGSTRTSLVGPVPPNGQRVTFELTNIFRYDDQGRLADEWIQTDNRSVLRQLGAEAQE
jgi:predicted ester cyclase